MILSPDDAELFFRLHMALMYFVNRRLRVVKLTPLAIDGPPVYPPASRLAIRNALLEQMHLIDAFVRENPEGFSDEELAIVASWKHVVSGKFFVFKHLKRYSVLLSGDEPPTAYGVLGLTEGIEDIVGPNPTIVDAALLPFKGCIVYDGVFDGYNISLGGGIRASLDQSYREAKEREGIITSLPAGKASPPRRTKKRKRRSTKKRKRRSTKKRKRRSTQAPTLRGRWRITEMELWDQDFVDAEVEGYFSFGRENCGEFRFGYVNGGMTYELIERDGRPGVEWTWEGYDEMDPASGRGWAVLDEHGMLKGKLHFHSGDASAFTAVR